MAQRHMEKKHQMKKQKTDLMPASSQQSSEAG